MNRKHEIALFKLLTSEEVIAEYTIDDLYLLKAPRRLFASPTPDGGMGVRMMPWIIGNPDGVFPIHASHVVSVSAEMSDQLKNGYIKETTGIDMSATTPTKIIGV